MPTFSKVPIEKYGETFMSVIMLPVHPASFAHNFVSGLQSFYFSES